MLKVLSTWRKQHVESSNKSKARVRLVTKNWTLLKRQKFIPQSTYCQKWQHVKQFFQLVKRTGQQINSTSCRIIWLVAEIEHVKFLSICCQNGKNCSTCCAFGMMLSTCWVSICCFQHVVGVGGLLAYCCLLSAYMMRENKIAIQHTQHGHCSTAWVSVATLMNYWTSYIMRLISEHL